MPGAEIRTLYAVTHSCFQTTPRSVCYSCSCFRDEALQAQRRKGTWPRPFSRMGERLGVRPPGSDLHPRPWQQLVLLGLDCRQGAGPGVTRCRGMLWKRMPVTRDKDTGRRGHQGKSFGGSAWIQEQEQQDSEPGRGPCEAARFPVCPSLSVSSFGVPPRDSGTQR